MGHVSLCDVTLRDGEQAVGVAFTDEEKVVVAGELDRVGISQIQLGHPRQGGVETLRALRAARIQSPIEMLTTCFYADWKEEIDAGLAAHPDVLQVLIRSADALLLDLGISRNDAIARTRDMVEYARLQGAKTVAFGTTFSTQTEPDFLATLMNTAAHAGADRLTVADTMGVATPEAMAEMVANVRAAGDDLPVSVHCHDDFGLATANVLASIRAGAQWVDVCVNGVGERAGNACLEEVAVAAELLLGAETGVDLTALYGLSRTVASILRREVDPERPVVGDDAFAMKLDLHVRVARDQPEIISPYDPALVGNERHIRLGKGSGAFTVGLKLERLNLSSHDVDVDTLVEWVRQESERTKTFVSDETFASKVRGLVNQ